MKAARFSLAALLLWMAMIAVGCQALVSHTPLWSYLTVTLVVGFFGIALLAALVTTGASRGCLLGAAVAGGGYLLLTLYPSFGQVGGRLLTTRVLMMFWSQLGEKPPQPAPSAAGWSGSAYSFGEGEDGDYEMVMNTGYLSVLAQPNQTYFTSLQRFLCIGQCVWAILLAFPAGLFCGWLYERRMRRERRAKKQLASESSAA